MVVKEYNITFVVQPAAVNVWLGDRNTDFVCVLWGGQEQYLVGQYCS